MRPTINNIPVGFVRHYILGSLVRLCAVLGKLHVAFNPYVYACGWLHNPCREDDENFGPLARAVKRATRALYEASVDRKRGYFDE